MEKRANKRGFIEATNTEESRCSDVNFTLNISGQEKWKKRRSVLKFQV